MSWGDLSFQQWVGLIGGGFGLLVLIFNFMVSGSLERQIRALKAPHDEVQELADKVSTMHWALFISLCGVGVLFAVYQAEIGGW